jgi:hypothetical protein
VRGLWRADGSDKQNQIFSSSARFRDELVRVLLMMPGFTACFKAMHVAVAKHDVCAARAVARATVGGESRATIQGNCYLAILEKVINCNILDFQNERRLLITTDKKFAWKFLNDNYQHI